MGWQAQGLDGKRPCFTRIEEMAAHYIQEIKTVQPEAPISFGGYSLGGLVAYEMARQLSASGEPVGLLVLTGYLCRQAQLHLKFRRTIARSFFPPRSVPRFFEESQGAVACDADSGESCCLAS